jgi:hypothetical protein
MSRLWNDELWNDASDDDDDAFNDLPWRPVAQAGF